MAIAKRIPKAQDIDHDYVRMYYEHQYERMAEQYRLTMTNYVLSVSALAFTFGYQSMTQLNMFNGLGLPLIIITACTYC